MNTYFHVLSWCAKVLIFMTGQEDIEVLGFRDFVQSTHTSMAQNAFFSHFYGRLRCPYRFSLGRAVREVNQNKNSDVS